MAGLGLTRVASARRTLPSPSPLSTPLPTPTTRTSTSTRRVHRLAWSLLVGFHLLNALLAAVLALVHLLLSKPEWHESVKWMQIPMQTLAVAGWAYVVVALAHLLAAGSILIPALTSLVPTQRLAKGLGGAVTRRMSASRRLSILVRVPSATQRLAPLGRQLSRGYRALDGGLERYFGVDGYFGVHGRYFHATFDLLELLEMLTQTYQAYQISRSVGRRWINDLAVWLVLLNGLATPALMVSLRTRDRAQRLMRVVVDMLFDFCCAVVVPVCILFPFTTVYDWHRHGFPRALMFDDVWVAQSISEARQILVTSDADLLATLVPHVNFILCLLSVKKVLALSWTDDDIDHGRSSRAMPTNTVATGATTAIPTAEHTKTASSRDPAKRPNPSTDVGTWCPRLRLARIVPTIKSVADHSSSSSRRSAYEGNDRIHRWSVLFHVLSLFWGFGVLGVHLNAQRQAVEYVPGCRLYLKPWLSTNVSCAVMQVNCLGADLSGAADEMTSYLAGIERRVLTKLIWAHCPALEIPSVVAEFHHLESIEIYNSTLVAWPLTAAPRRGTHDSFNQLTLIHSNLSVLPEALIHDALPSSWEFFSALRSNLSAIPEAVGQHWSTHTWNRLTLEHTLISALPGSLARVDFRGLYLIHNPIARVPESIFAGKRLRLLRLSSPALLELPESIGNVADLDLVLVENSQVAALEPWVWTWLETVWGRAENYTVSFAGSPVCANGSALMTSRYATMACGLNRYSDRGSYPYDLIAAQRPLYNTR